MEFGGAEAAPADGHEPGSKLILGNGIRRCASHQSCYLRIGQHSAVALLANQIYYVHAAASSVAIRAKIRVDVRLSGFQAGQELGVHIAPASCDLAGNSLLVV